jgi:DNA-binding NtrC family response regulator
VKGAFTDARNDRAGYFEVAHGGTLFLDEIGNVPMAQQAKLLRVLETGELQPVGSSRTRKVDARILTATNSELDRAVSEGTFREDLFYRLNTVEVRLPPLRERREDIPLLATHFLGASGRKYGRNDLELASAALDAMYRHSWPGNVRELRHSIERAVLLVDGRTVDVEHLGLRQAPEGSLSLEDVALDEAERILIRKALARNRGNVSRAADELGLSRSALYRRLKRHGLHV